MNREEIISKGFYTYPQHKDYVCVKQYIVLKDAGKKYLTLRMVNNHTETATGLTLFVRQYDASSNFIVTEKVEVDNISIKPDGVFSLGQRIELREECADFEVDIVSMTFGAYKYVVKDGEVIPVFSMDEDSAPPDKAEITYKMRKSKQTVSKRNGLSTRYFVLFASVVLLVLCAFSAFQIFNFMNTEKVFTLDDIEYSFETDDHVSGPICITKYKGFAGNIVVPEEIEGYRVARIAKETFANSWIGSVKIEGDVVIEDSAFYNCTFLKSVTLEKVSSIGDYAFYNCSSLESVSLNSATVTIGESAFAKCNSLKELTLPETLEHIGKNAFLGCSSLESVAIPERVQTIGEGVFAGCSKIKELTIPFLGADIQTPKTISYLFTFKDKVYSPSKTYLSLTIGRMDKIESDTFAGCTYIEKLDFTHDVVEISDKAFSGCKNLKSIDTTDALMIVGEGAFEKCTSLKSIYLSDNVKEIKPQTFYKCVSLVDVRMSDKLVTVGSHAFDGCTSLTVLKFPSTVGTIDEKAFYNCTALRDLTVPFLGVNESTPSGISTWFGSSSKSLEKITVLRCNVIPEQAFKGCTSLKEVKLPEMVNGIGKQAFLNCTELESFDFPIGVSYIDEQAFKGCTSLKEIKLSNKVTKIGSSAFEDCVLLNSVELSDMIRTIDPYAFAGCVSLESFKVPANTKVISEGMLYGCSNLESVTFSVILEEIDVRAFEGCTKLCKTSLPEDKSSESDDETDDETVEIKALTFPDNVSSLGAWAFSGCSSFEEIVVPSSVKSMGEGVFNGCTSVRSLQLPDLKKSEAEYGRLGFFFAGADVEDETAVPESLKTVVLTEAQYLQAHAFANCVYIEEITLPVTIRTIGAFSFQNCVGLEKLVVPTYTESIGQGAFSGCSSLNEISVPMVPSGNKNVGGFQIWFGDVPKSLERVRITYTTQIEEYAFSGCSDIKEIIFDSDVEIIKAGAFYNCTKLSKITLPRCLVFVGQSAFEGCYRLYDVINDSNLSFSSTDNTFLGRYALSIHKSTETAKKAYVNDFEFLCLEKEGKNGSVIEEWYLIGYQGDETEWRLPNGAEFEEYIIANYAFFDEQSVESVYFPWNVKAFGKSMFAFCGNLKEVTFDKNTTATIVSAGAFESCDKLEKIELPGVITTIEDYAFRDCSSLLQISLPSGFSRIGQDAFSGCTNMLEVVNNGMLTLQLGSVANGEIARYALQVVSSGTLSNVTSVTVDGVTFKFAKISGVWYLYDTIRTDDFDGSVVDLSKIEVASKEGYTIIKDALVMDGVSKFVIPTSVKRVTDQALTNLCGEHITVYYKGTQEAWNVLVPDSRATVYYYAKCIHENVQWKYDSEGNVTTAMKTVVKEAIEATCAKEGENHIICSVCKTVLHKQTVPAKNHAYENGSCVVCGKTKEN